MLNIDSRLVQPVWAMKSLKAVVKYGSESIGNHNFIYDVHEMAIGYNASYEILPYREKGYDQSLAGVGIYSLEPTQISSDVILMPYSGFALPAHDENLEPDAGRDDHYYLQGTPIRGVDLFTFGPSRDLVVKMARFEIEKNYAVKRLLLIRP